VLQFDVNYEQIQGDSVNLRKKNFEATIGKGTGDEGKEPTEFKRIHGKIWYI
jgi:phage-related protein